MSLHISESRVQIWMRIWYKGGSAGFWDLTERNPVLFCVLCFDGQTSKKTWRNSRVVLGLISHVQPCWRCPIVPPHQPCLGRCDGDRSRGGESGACQGGRCDERRDGGEHGRYLMRGFEVRSSRWVGLGGMGGMGGTGVMGCR